MRGREGSSEPRGFHHANARVDFISVSARGSWAGRECQAPESSPRLALTRTSSASSSSSTLWEVTRSPLPPDKRTCFSAQLGPRSQVPPRRFTRVKGQSATRAAEALLEQTSTLSPKLGVPREGKRTLPESFTPTEKAHPTPLKSSGQASPGWVGHPDPTLLCL